MKTKLGRAGAAALPFIETKTNVAAMAKHQLIRFMGFEISPP